MRPRLAHPLELMRLLLLKYVHVIVRHSLLGDNDLLGSVDDEVTTLIEDTLPTLNQISIVFVLQRAEIALQHNWHIPKRVTARGESASESEHFHWLHTTYSPVICIYNLQGPNNSRIKYNDCLPQELVWHLFPASRIVCGVILSSNWIDAILPRLDIDIYGRRISQWTQPRLVRIELSDGTIDLENSRRSDVYISEFYCVGELPPHKNCKKYFWQKKMLILGYHH
jgi:hypothetical protein